MNLVLRMPRTLCEEMRRDLLRPHPFAAERVGFARVALGTGEGTMLLLLQSYWGVPDDQYVDDPRVGARINSTAIRAAMQDALDGGHGLFHVHMHHHRGPTRLSRTDQQEIPRLVNSFRSVGPTRPHGFLILTFDHCLGFAWMPKAAAAVNIASISIVGYPMERLT